MLERSEARGVTPELLTSLTLGVILDWFDGDGFHTSSSFP